MQQLREAGEIVAFVGDGLNDAVAISGAHLGVSLAGGADVATEAAGVTLMRGDLRLVADSLDVSRRTYSKIKQGLFWAFAYNVALIPVAAGLLFPGFGILMSPVFAAGAMALSSVFVLGNALRLRRFGAPSEGAA